MNVPDDLKYAKSHEWARVGEDGIATVGITDHAQTELTDVVFVDLPTIGAEVTAGGEAATIDSIKAANEIYSPVSGEVVDVNEALAEEPGIINTDPYGEGWMFKVKVSGGLDDLLDAAAYKELIS